MHHVLLIDDDQPLTALFADFLRQEGFRVSCRHDGASGCELALRQQVDIVVLDIMMPGMDGIAVLRELRAQGTVPVLMLSARGDAVDRILGLELGADDYVAKPCPPRELSARIKAILRRTAVLQVGSPPAAMVVGSLTLQPERREARWLDQPLSLTGIEYNLLEVLARHAGRVVSKRQLSEQALGRDLERFDRSIDVHISSIRQKLPRQADGQSRILTIRGMGYQLLKD
ncbi:response regulator transcription factor [Paludibacterium purpuratum]|uniref:Two-component system OmpR family response regulator/two-component system response regulator CpxR n=1 Tax=Paludibacterium purpuratum TaxID=1144873 RepID=A0A4V3DV60_9NEIS|nr:response regulator transcription factor [Paludibacterium purpuratum]TDR79779.1 two-component system OmpR family response regulator/two-component system response regulator CpxR [Paludibacterium purpuratum]